MTDVDLFGGAITPAPRPPRVVFLDEPKWQKLFGSSRPRCAHCTMLRYATTDDPQWSLRQASWTRTGIDGSVMDLCDPHTDDQRQRDARLGEQAQYAESYLIVRDGIISLMADPDAEDGEDSEPHLLVAYVMRLLMKIQDIELILDRDMRE